jgi:carboxypeptidase Q
MNLASRPVLSVLPFLVLAVGQPVAGQEDAAARGAAEAPAVPVLDQATADRIIAEGIQHSHAMQMLRGLTGIGHRLTGSDNFTKACEWTLAEFQHMGLDAHLEKWAEWRLCWNRGAWIGRIVSEPKVDMYVATEAWTAGTRGLQRGRLVRAPKDEAEFEARKDQLAGAWLYRTGPFTEREPTREEDKEAFRKQMQLKEGCNQAGILGWVYGAAGGGGYPTRVRVFGNHLTAMKTMADVPTVPEIAVRSDHAKDLASRLDAGKEVVVEFDIQNSFREGPIALHNVIAELKGSEKPDEVVIVSSHLDSWHQATGTTDNGTGTDTNMEAARCSPPTWRDSSSPDSTRTAVANGWASATAT